MVYEDENIAALYKPAHLLCHSDRTGDVSLVELFTDYLAEKGEYDAAAEAAFSPALCNRIDRGTEGLVLAAKNYAALRDMNELIRRDLLQKEYYCITAGVPPKGHTQLICVTLKKTIRWTCVPKPRRVTKRSLPTSPYCRQKGRLRCAASGS